MNPKSIKKSASPEGEATFSESFLYALISVPLVRVKTILSLLYTVR